MFTPHQLRQAAKEEGWRRVADDRDVLIDVCPPCAGVGYPKSEAR